MILRILLLTSFLLHLGVSISSGVEVRKYQFAGDLPSYQSSTNGFWLLGMRARVEGTFEVEIDRELGVGTLVSLNAHLTNSEGRFADAGWQPLGSDREFLEPGRFYDPFRPRFGGVFEAAVYRPLGPGTKTNAHRQQFVGLPLSEYPRPIVDWLNNGVGYEAAPANSWMLDFDGVVPNLANGTTGFFASYNIYFEANEAFLTYDLPIIDGPEAIVAARAFLIPEPTGLGITWLVIAWMIGYRRRQIATALLS